MLEFGGFEGNAQTLRILSRLEKKITTDPLAVGVTDDGRDLRFGLDLSARTLAAVLKYDEEIPLKRPAGAKLVKGYYRSEAKLVAAIKAAVGGQSGPRGKFKTLECQVMDIADDIAYSTYDLEDAFKAGFLTPFQLLAAKKSMLADIADAIRKRAKDEGMDDFTHVSGDDVQGVLLDVFGAVVEDNELQEAIKTGKPIDYNDIINFALRRYADSVRMAQVGYARTGVTSALVGQFIAGVRFHPNESHPVLSAVKLEAKTWIRVEVLKRFCYRSLIMSSRLKVAEQRGQEVVTEIFDHLAGDEGHRLLPDDFSDWYTRLKTESDRMRVICDFIAGMTDRYAVEFHSRLKSETPQTIFKPI
jgi:dGTPase